MAKKKLNVKFLALVLGSLGVGVAVLGLVVLLQFRNDPVRHVKRGDTLMQQGDYAAAMQQYIRAIGKDPSAMEYYDLAIEASRKIEPQSVDRTRELYQMLNSVIAKKIEYANPTADLSAREVRDQATSEFLDNLTAYTYALPRMRDNLVIRHYDMISSRVRDVDASFYGLGENEVSPRIRSAVRGRVVSPFWRGAYNLDEGDWEDGVEEIQEAIDLDPGYVPNQYGLIRGMLDRFESSLRSAPDSTLRRMLAGEGGINERIEEARKLANGPAPELDMLELERDQILYLAGRTGDGDDALGPDPDPATVERLVGSIRDLGASEYEQYELRSRLSEIWWSIYGAIGRNPLVDLDGIELDQLMQGIGGVMPVALEEIKEIAPDGQRDFRSDYFEILSTNPAIDPDELESAVNLMDDLIAAVAEEKRLGPNLLVGKNVRSTALQKRFDLVLREYPLNEVLSDEGMDGLIRCYEDIKATYPDEATREQDPRWARIQLLYKARRSMDSEQRSLSAENEQVAREMDQESMRYASEATAAARACEKDGSLMDGLALEAAILMARRTGEVGTATRLFQIAMERNPNSERNLGLQARLAQMMAQSGDIDGAKMMIDGIRRAVDDNDQDTIERLVMVEDIIRRSESGNDLTDLPGIELLNEVMKARIAGDVDEIRRLLDVVVDGRNIDRRVQLIGLLERAGFEESEGNFEEMRMFATRALEIDPTSLRAKVFLQTDEESTTLDRMRVGAEAQFENQDDIDVQLCRNIGSMLGNPGTTPSDQVQEMRDMLAVLQARLEASGSQRPMVLNYLFDKSMMAPPDYVKAGEYLDQLTLVEGGDTPKTIAMAASLAQKQGDLDGSIRILADAIDNKGFGSDTMRLLLGEAYAMRGDQEDARAQFHEAFKQAPNRWKNALRYGQALISDGMMSDALQVLRAGRSAGRSNPNYRDTWLFLEIQTGNFENAIDERRRLFAIDNFERKNAIELARLLAESPVGRKAIVHAESDPRTGVVAGEPRFNAVSWGRLSRDDRRAFQVKARNERLEEARSIFEEILKNDPNSPDIVVGAVAFSTNHPDHALEGDLIGNAEASLRKGTTSNDESVRLRSSGRLSRILAEKGKIAYLSGDKEAAEEIFDEAVQQQSQQVDEAVTAIVSSLLGFNDLNLAAKYQRILLDRMEKAKASVELRRGIAAQLASFYVGNEQIEKAAEIAATYFDSESKNSAELAVLGTIAFGEAEVLRRESGQVVGGGLPEAVIAKLDEANEIYGKSLAINARNLEALMQLAVVAEYRWLYASDDEEEAAFDEAVKAMRNAVDYNKAYWPARLRLVQLLARDDRYAEGITELRDHLDLAPDNNRARSLLIDMLQQDGRITDAIDLAQSSLERDTTNVEWARALGRLRGMNKEYSEAAQLFAALYEQTGDIDYLRSQVMSLMAWTDTGGGRPGASEVVNLVRTNEREFSRDLTLIGAYCAALIKSGRRNEGLRNFEATYRQMKDLPSQERVNLTRWLPDLYPKTPDGAANLSAFVDRISDEKPKVNDLIAVASTWDSIGQDGLEAAIGTVRRAVAIDADETETASALGLLGILLTKNDDCSGALDAFGRALALRTDDPQLLNNMAFLTAKCDGDLEEALVRARQAVKERPYRSEFRDTLGAVYLARARKEEDSEAKRLEYDRARGEYTIAARLGNLPSPLLQLAELEIETGNLDAARNALVRAGDLNLDADSQARVDEMLKQVTGP